MAVETTHCSHFRSQPQAKDARSPWDVTGKGWIGGFLKDPLLVVLLEEADMAGRASEREREILESNGQQFEGLSESRSPDG